MESAKRMPTLTVKEGEGTLGLIAPVPLALVCTDKKHVVFEFQLWVSYSHNTDSNNIQHTSYIIHHTSYIIHHTSSKHTSHIIYHILYYYVIQLLQSIPHTSYNHTSYIIQSYIIHHTIIQSYIHHTLYILLSIILNERCWRHKRRCSQ